MIDQDGFCTDVGFGAKHTHEQIEWATRFIGFAIPQRKLPFCALEEAELGERELWPMLNKTVPQLSLTALRPLFPAIDNDKKEYTARGLAWHIIATISAGRIGPVRLMIVKDKVKYYKGNEFDCYDLQFVEECLKKWKEEGKIMFTKGNTGYISTMRCEKLAEEMAQKIQGSPQESSQGAGISDLLPVSVQLTTAHPKAVEIVHSDLKTAVFASVASATFFPGKRVYVDKALSHKYKSVMSIIDDCMAPKDISNDERKGRKYIYEKDKDGQADARQPKAIRRAVSDCLDHELTCINGNQAKVTLFGRDVSNGAAYHGAEYVCEGFQEGGGRFYCLLQGLTPVIRKELRINGSATIEMDLRASHLTQAYLMAGMVPDMTKDLYVEGFRWATLGVAGETPALRKAVKIITNVILNAKGGGLAAVRRQCELKAVDAALAAAVTADLVHDDIRDDVRFCFKHPKGERNAAALNVKLTKMLKARSGFSLPAIRELADELDDALRLNKQGTPAASSVWRSFDPKAMYEEICRLHAPIKGRLGSGFGYIGQANEGLVMRRTLMRLIAAGVPCPIQVHDSLHCREEDADLVQKIWSEEWQKLLRCSPAIDRK